MQLVVTLAEQLPLSLNCQLDGASCKISAFPGPQVRSSVQLMHQLSADTEVAMLAPDLSNQLLLASARDPGKPSRCLALHSLNPELGLFSPQGRISLPPTSSPTPSVAGSGQLKPQVQSSHNPHGGDE